MLQLWSPVGASCWLTDDANAAPLTDEFFATLQLSVPVECTEIIPPCEFFDVGAPRKVMGKAMSKRGAHLKRGTACHVLDKIASGVLVLLLVLLVVVALVVSLPSTL